MARCQPRELPRAVLAPFRGAAVPQVAADITGGDTGSDRLVVVLQALVIP